MVIEILPTANCLADFLVLSGTLTMGRCRPTRMTPLIWGPQRWRNTKHVRFQNHYFSIFSLNDFCAWLKTWCFMIFLMEELWDHGSCLSQCPQCPRSRTWGSHSWHFWNGFLVQEWILVCLSKTAVPTKKIPWLSNSWKPEGEFFLDDAGSQLLEAQHIHICIPGIHIRVQPPKERTNGFLFHVQKKRDDMYVIRLETMGIAESLNLAKFEI